MISSAWPCTLLRRRPQDKAVPSIIQHRYRVRYMHERSRSGGWAQAGAHLSAGWASPESRSRAAHRARRPRLHPAPSITGALMPALTPSKILVKKWVRKSKNPLFPFHLLLISRRAGTWNCGATLTDSSCFKAFLHFDANELWKL